MNHCSLQLTVTGMDKEGHTSALLGLLIIYLFLYHCSYQPEGSSGGGHEIWEHEA